MALKAKILQDLQVAGLPMLVVSPVDVGRLLSEVERIDEAMKQDALRHAETGKHPKTSRLLDQTVELNKLDLSQPADREKLLALLRGTKKQAPVLHMSFSSDPAPAFLQQLLTWLRREIHPLLLVTVGLQPSIGAGCVVRSTNKYFDMSLRSNLKSSQVLLQDALAAVNTNAEPPPA